MRNFKTHLHVVFLARQTGKDFKWENYEGLKDFYGFKMPEWKMIGWVWHKPEDWTEEQWAFFLMWAERSWDQKEDLAFYVEKWTDEDWKTFKTWMDAEFQDYQTYDKSLHKDTFIR